MPEDKPKKTTRKRKTAAKKQTTVKPKVDINQGNSVKEKDINQGNFKPSLINLIAKGDTTVNYGARIAVEPKEDLQQGKVYNIRGTKNNFEIGRFSVVPNFYLPDEDLTVEVINLMPQAYIIKKGAIVAQMAVLK